MPSRKEIAEKLYIWLRRNSELKISKEKIKDFISGKEYALVFWAEGSRWKSLMRNIPYPPFCTLPKGMYFIVHDSAAEYLFCGACGKYICNISDEKKHQNCKHKILDLGLEESIKEV